MSGEDKFTKVKRLMGRIRGAKLAETFEAWKDLSTFEETARGAYQLLDAIAPIFDKKYVDRSPNELAQVAQVISLVKVFRKMEPEVLTFLAAHASLAVMWESNELPRNNLDRSNMYSIVSGAVKGIVGDENDPHLRNLVKMAADELVEMHAAKIIGEEISTSRTNFNAAYGLVGTEYGSKLVRNKIWRSVLFHIHQGHGQKVTSRKQSLIGSTAHGSLMRGESAGHQPEGGPGPGTSPRASDPAEGMAIANHIKRDQLDPAAGQIAADIEAVVEVVTEIQDELAEELKREAEEKKTSRHTIPNGPTIATFEAWDSFSGCNLDCRAESGQSEYQMLDFPQKVHGAVSVKDCLVTMLVISKQAYSKAMHMQMDLLVQKNVDHCCRLPFLRHTPLRELFRLSRYLQEETFSRGTTILQQGKENTSLHFLIQGEVEIVIDLPLSTNKTLLAASLQAGQLAERPASLAHAPSMARRNIQNLDGSPVHPDVMTAIMYKGPMQRIMLGRRGPGVVLGDDSLRERRMVVSVVALSGTVKTLSITPQRFSMCIDPLTLRLMHKLQKQHNATAEFTSAVGDVSGRTLLLDRCREVMLTQSYERMKKPIKVNAIEGDSKLWKRSDAVGGHFSSFESLTEGERRVLAAEEAAAAAIKAGLYEAHAQVMLSPRTMVATNAATSRAVSGSKVPLVGISTSMFKGMRVGGSLAKFIETVQTVEEQRAVQQVVDAKMRQKMVDLDLTGETHPSVVKKLDISGSGVSMASHRVYTDMVEAAAIACIRVGFVPGQPEIPMDELAPVLDDAAVAWSQIAHESELQLVRWKSHEFYLLGGLGMGRGKKPMVRMISDSLLQILESFKNIIAHNPVPHHTFSAGLAIGAIFASYDCGRFMTGVSGQAAVAAQKLCAKSCADFPTGAILCTDAVMQATSRTHELRFVASGYQLVRAVELPYSAKFDDVFGRGSLEKEPVSQGNTALASLNVQAIKSSHFGDSGTWYSLDDGLPCTGPVSADASRSNLNQTPASPTGRLTLSPITVQADKSYNADSDSPASASGSPKLTMKSHGTRRGSNLDGAKRKHGLKALPGQLQADPSHISDSGKQAATAPRTTLEPRMRLTYNSKKREHMMARSNMDLRQQLRQEVLRASASSIPTAATPASPTSLPTKAPLPTPWYARTSSGHKTHDDSDNPIASWSLTGLGPSTSASVSRADAAGSRQGSREQVGGIHSITPYGPGTKLGSVSARQRSADILFGSAAAVASGMVSPAEAHGMGRTHSMRVSTPNHSSSRPSTPSRASTGQVMFPELSTPSLRPFSPGKVEGLDGFATAGRTSLFGGQGFAGKDGASSAPSSRAGTPNRGTRQPSPAPNNSRTGTPSRGTRQPGEADSQNFIHSNFGPVPISVLTAVREGISSGEGGPSQAQGLGETRPTSHHSAKLPSRPSTGTRPGPCTDEQVGNVSGLSRKTIHKEAVQTWKDLGSVKAAEEYIQLLPIGIMNVSFSTAFLTRIPALTRLPFLESLAASFNMLGHVSSDQLSSISPNLKVLNISFCQLQALPNDMPKQLPSLTELNISNNLLEELPEGLFSLSQLRALSIQGNKLQHLHRSLEMATSLEVLYAGGNQLSKLPDVFRKLPSLQLLNVSSNRLDELPLSLTALTELKSLCAKKNNLMQLPPGFLKAATSLTELDLCNNSMACCPQITGNPNAGIAALVSTPLSFGRELGGLGSTGRAGSAGTNATSAPLSRLGTPQTSVPPFATGALASANILAVEGTETNRTQGETNRTMDSVRTLDTARAGMDDEEDEVQAFMFPDEGDEPLLPNLLTFSLSSNCLRRLPPWLPPSLEFLDVSCNKLRQLPDWAAGRLKSLQHLDMHDNKMIHISRNLSELTNLHLAALQENPCTGVEAKGSEICAAWVAEWQSGIKFRRRATIMTQAAASAGLTTTG